MYFRFALDCDFHKCNCTTMLILLMDDCLAKKQNVTMNQQNTVVTSCNGIDPVVYFMVSSSQII